ncbi:MAG: magnesium transporter [Phycisphaerae bacterium]|nr:magnesium transporter [Phycisphaerae bacterium]
MTTPDVDSLSVVELTEAWPALSDEDRVQGFVMLSWEDAEEFFSHLSAHDAAELVLNIPEYDRQRWLRSLPPDDVADIVQEAPEEEHEAILGLLEPSVREETVALLAYDEDDAGGLMTPRYARLQAGMTAAEAIDYLRQQKSQNAEIIYYGYVVEAEDRLVGVVSFRELVMSPPEQKLRDLMTTEIVTIPEDMDQEEVSRIYAHEDLLCLPVVDAEGCMKGIVTADDIVDVVDEEATEDMQKIGGTEALDAPYLQVGFLEMLRKRGVWLILLLLLGFFTVEAMGRYEEELRKLVVLSLFIPLIISCGGNTGSQASTLVVRAMALDEVRLRDWWRVVKREFVMGLGLGTLLAVAGVLAALLWNMFSSRMGSEPMHMATAVGGSILCVVLWGTLAGSMLPFLLRRCGADPASASAPLVATLVDASGLVIYFTVAGLILQCFAA